MSEECTHDCGSCASDCDSRNEQKSFKVAQNASSQIKHVIGVVSGKGGVGKSLVTAMLASATAKEGFRVGVLDSDITGPSIPKILGTSVGAEPAEGGIMPAQSIGGIKYISINSLLPSETDPVIWRGPILANVVTQFWKDVVWGNLDYLYVDMPPGTGDVALTVFQSLPIDGIIVVTSPQELVEMIVGKAVNMAGMMDIPVIGLVENMAYFVCPNCSEKHYIFGNTNVKELAAKFDIKNTAEIPINPKIAALCDQGKAELIDNSCLKEVTEALISFSK